MGREGIMKAESPEKTEWRGKGGAGERFFCMTAEPGACFEAELHSLMDRYQELGGGEEDEFLLRFHVSDPVRQAETLRRMAGERNSYVSVVGQPPANGARVALEAWHIGGMLEKRKGAEEGGTVVTARRPHYRLFLAGRKEASAPDSYGQMREEFHWLDRVASAQGATVPELVHRTWIYCRDIDNNYRGLVEGRNECFDRYGLTPESHFIASTGIEGCTETPGRLLHMDSLGIAGLRPEQVRYMEAPDYLSPTHLYRVAFERGTRIVYGDRSHYFLSGTASIDAQGNIVHPGDVARQTDRTLENMNALMKRNGGSLSDLKQAVVYLRDWADRETVRRRLMESPLAAIPHVMLKAPVCRPGWLVEIDGIAVNGAGDGAFAPL